MSEQPWLRYIEVIIGPLPEWKGGGDEQKAVKISSDGTLKSLKVTFNVHKHIVSTARPSCIEIYNLSQGLRNSLRGSLNQAQVILRAGWQNSTITTIGKGTLLSAVPQRRSTDIVTTIQFLAGYGGLEKSVVSSKWAGGTKLSNVVQFLANEIVGISVDPKRIKVKDVEVPPRGLSFAGLASELLDSLSRTYGFSWGVDHGMFYAYDDKEFVPNSVIDIGSENGLLRAEPMLYTPYQQQYSNGVTIHSMFNPYATTGKGVRLNSQVNKNLNGVYLIQALSHFGDISSSQWVTSIESWRKLG